MAHNLGEPGPDALDEQLAVRDGGIVHRDADPGIARVGEQRDVRRRSHSGGQRVHRAHLRAGDPHGDRHAGHIAGGEVTGLRGRGEHLGGHEAVPHLSHRVDQVQRRLVPPGADDLADGPHPLDRVEDVHGDLEAGDRDGVLRRTIRVAQADRHVAPQHAHRLAPALVVDPQATGDTGHERVIEAHAVRLGGGLELRHRDVEGDEVVVDRPPAHHGGHRRGRHRQELGDGFQHPHDVLDRADGVAQRTPSDRQCGVRDLLHRLHEEGRRVHNSRSEEARSVQWSRGRRRGHRAQVLPTGHQVDHRRSEHHRALTVGDGVMQLDDQRRPPALEALEERHTPQRPGKVEIGHRLPSGLDQHLVPAAGVGHPEAAHVEAEVEVGVDHQARAQDVRGTLEHLLPQDRGNPAGPVEPIDELVPVGAGLQCDQPDDRRAHRRVI